MQGVIYDSFVLKLGGLFKKKWTSRWAFIKNIANIGKIFEWREDVSSNCIKHWVQFSAIELVEFKTDGILFTMNVFTKWREYQFRIQDEQTWNEWKMHFDLLPTTQNRELNVSD